MTKTRSASLDVVRILGVIAVAVGHLWPGPVDEPSTLRVLIYSWQVPIFFFLTGYLWTHGRTVSHEASSRAWTLLMPYAAWTLLLGVPLFATQTFFDGVFPAREVLLTLWGGGLVRGPFAPYWFLPVLFFVAVLLRLVERLPVWVQWALGCFGLATSYLWGEALSMLPLDVFFALPCLLFALAGRTFRRYESTLRTRGARTTVGGGLLAVSVILLVTRVVAPLDIKLGDFGIPGASMLVAVAICSGLVLLAEVAFGDRSNSSVSELATVSVVVLLTHTFGFAVLGRMGLPDIAVLGGSLALSWGVALLLHRSSMSRWLVGVQRRQEKIPRV